MKNILTYLIFLFLFCLFLSLWGFYSAIRPTKIISTDTPATYHVAYENVSFYTSDHIKISGWYIPAEKKTSKTIILLHGYPADKGNILPSRIFLHQNFNLLFIDFRYFGESEGSYSTIGKNEVLDLLAAINYLHSRGIHSVGIWGVSLGGAVALMTAERTTAIKAMVIESAYARLDWMAYEYYHIPLLRYPLGELTRWWGIIFLHDDIKNISPMHSAEKIKIPVLLIHSKNDTVVPFIHAQMIEQSLSDNPNLQVWYVNEVHHGNPIKNYQQIITQFFLKNL